MIQNSRRACSARRHKVKSMLKGLKKTRLWAGLCSIFSVLLCCVTVGSGVANAYSGTINQALNITVSEIVTENPDPNEDTVYYKSSFGAFNESNLKKLQAAAREQAVAEMREGAALLYNPESALPLKTEKKITLFGRAAATPSYQAQSAGNKVADDTVDKVTLKDGLEGEGFAINEAVWNALRSSETKITVGSAAGFEETPGFYRDCIEQVKDYDDAAIVVLTRQGAEGTDLAMDDVDDDGQTVLSALALHSNEREMLKLVRGKFDKVIVLLNSANPMEVEELKNYCDAILFIGYPGQYGFEGVAEILRGTVNPSGRLADTYAVNSLSSPAVVNSGTRTPRYTNASEIDSRLGSSEKATYMSFQAESIYVGYRYYETRYYDCVTGFGGAASCVGASSGAAKWEYANEVSYPFGYGLSYTAFEQSLDGVTVEPDRISVTVTVKNVGTMAGRSVVQVYAQTPYGDYEVKNGVEKSAVQLVGFDKTETLEAGASRTLTIAIDPYLLASYDAKTLQSYYLSGGDYSIAIGGDSHDALNNILAAQGYTEADGMDDSGDASKAYKYVQAFDDETYAEGENGAEITNRFEDCDLNNWQADAGTYLTRSDWEGTYPAQQTAIAASAAMMQALSGEWYAKPADAPSYNQIASQFGQNNDLTVIDMRDVPITDTETWRKFVLQMDLDDLPTATGANFVNDAIEPLSPSFVVGDGCDSVAGSITIYAKSGTNQPADSSDSATLIVACIRYCSKTILAGTFDPDRYASRGMLMGEEGLWRGNMENFGIGANLHRTPFGGRNFEYYSECPALTYFAAMAEVEAMESTGVHACAKHFTGNDQEFQREGVSVFFSEQAFREGNLRAFEGALREAKAGGYMSSFERLGTVWSSASYAMNTEIVRGEWGYQGHAITDGAAAGTGYINHGAYKDHAVEVFAAGTQQWCLDSNVGHGKAAMEIARQTNDGNILELMIDAAIHWEYAIVNSSVINGISAHSRIVSITPWWRTALDGTIIALSVLTSASVILLAAGTVWKGREAAQKKRKGMKENET